MLQPNAHEPGKMRVAAEVGGVVGGKSQTSARPRGDPAIYLMGKAGESSSAGDIITIMRWYSFMPLLAIIIAVALIRLSSSLRLRNSPHIWLAFQSCRFSGRAGRPLQSLLPVLQGMAWLRRDSNDLSAWLIIITCRP